jgi:DNA-binding MarR family transcriptional regulator
MRRSSRSRASLTPKAVAELPTRERVQRRRVSARPTAPARLSRKPASFAFEEQVYLISHLVRLINARAEGLLAKSGIRYTYPQASVLIRLLRTPGMSAAEMARLSDVRPQTVLKLLSQLYKNKLIDSRRDPAHGRIRRLHLSPRGLEIAQKCDAISSEIFAKLTDSIPQPLLQRFHRYLLDAIALLQADLGRRRRPLA